MGPGDSNESRHSLPMGVGNDKRVGAIAALMSPRVPSGKEMVERSLVFNPQTLRKNCACYFERNCEGAVCSNGI